MDLGYQINIPNRPNKPTNDQPQMTINANSINSWVNQDHIGFNTSNSTGGYHAQVHMVANQTSPGINTAQGVIYANTGTAISQLFYDNGTTNYQLWSGQSSAAANPGYIKIGNIMIQWGFATGIAGTTNTITFTPNFSNNAYVVHITPSFSGGSQPSNPITFSTKNFTSSQFTWFAQSVSAGWNQFSWTAIGPTT